MKNLIIKLSLIIALVVACGSASAVFVDNPNTLALWHCDSTNWDGTTELTPDDNSTGRTAHDMQINVTNAAVMMPGSPYGGSYLEFSGDDRGLGLDVLATDPDILQVDFAFRASELPAAGAYNVILYPYALNILLFDGGHIRVLASDDEGSPQVYLQSSKAINIDTWYTVSVVASNSYVQITAGNDAEGYETDGKPMGAGLNNAPDIPIGWHPFASALDTAWTFKGDLDEVRISLPIPEPFTFGFIGLVGFLALRRRK